LPPAPAPAAPPPSADDAARSALLAGGKLRPTVAVAPEPEPEPEQEPLDVPDDDGNVTFDFDDLNLAETMAGSPGKGDGGGGGGAPEALDFAVIDEDLSKFAQDEKIRDALARGVDLRLYARQVDAELRHLEMESIADYVGQADAVAGLFDQISHCEAVLGAMQGMLSTFQDNLGGSAWKEGVGCGRAAPRAPAPRPRPPLPFIAAPLARPSQSRPKSARCRSSRCRCRCAWPTARRSTPS
jgi:hypothetical protein